MKRKIFAFIIALVSVISLASCLNETSELSNINLDTSLAKLVYQMDEEIDLSGLKVKTVYTDNDMVVVDLKDCVVDTSAFKPGVPGKYEIKVSYTKSNITKVAVFEVEVVEATPVSLRVDTSNAVTTFVVGDEFSHKGISIFVVYSDKTEAAYAAEDFVVDDSGFNPEVIGEYNIKVSLVVGDKTLEGSYKAKVETNIVTINNVQDFLDMREFQNAEGENSKIYTLACDLDLTNIELVPTTTIFTGSFNGAGHTIKNAVYNQTGSKQGLMFSKVDGAIIENVNFFACTVVGGASETVAIIAGECNNTGATFKNIEFSCCTVNNGAQNYAALVVGRNESKQVVLNFENITVKNLTSVSSKQYAGCLIGDVIKGSTINATNCDLDVTLNAANNISVFSGRNRGATVNVNGAVVRLVLGASTTASSNQVGIFADGNATSTIVANNVIILKEELSSVLSANADMMCGRNSNLENATLTNVLYVTDKCELTSSLPGVSGILEAIVNSSYIMETLQLADTVWEEDANKFVKLICSTANTPSDGAVVNNITIITSTVEKQYFVGEEISLEGLIVTAIYSDGCVIATTEYTPVIRNEIGTPITIEDFKNSPIGKYTVSIEIGDVSADYIVYIVEETGIEVRDQNVQKVYQVNDEINTVGLVVFVELSDDTHTLLSSSDYQVVIKDLEGNKVEKLDKAGKYIVNITREVFVQTYEILVLADDILEESEVVVHVDPSFTDGTYTDKKEAKFSTIQKALDYLKSRKLNSQVLVTIHIAEGEYNEKITIDLPNVTLIGETTDYHNVKIVSDTASGTELLDETGTYGTDNSATVIIASSATNFTASNIYFVNSFDYNNSTLANKQALAVRCDADQAIFNYCGFSGHQDTLEAKKGRQYYYNCYIEGCVDFIFGNNATAVFESCEVKALTRYASDGSPDDNNGYVCAPKGYSTGSGTDTVKYNYVFLNCQFTAATDVLDGSMSVARPWGVDASVVTINCEFSSAYAVLGYNGTDKSRYFDMSGNSPLDAKFYEYNNSGEGSISEEVAGMKMLTEEDANTYTLANIFAKVNGQVEYAENWVVTLDPKDITRNGSIVYFGLEKEEYNEKEKVIDPIVVVYNYVGNGLKGYEISPYEASFKYFDEEEKEVTDITSKAGTYTVKLFKDEKVIGTATITVIEAKNTETKTLLASDATESTVARGTEYLEGLFTIYGKVDGSAVSVSSCTTTDGITDYTKLMKISGGKAVASSDVASVANCVKVVLDKAGTIRMVVSQKNATASSGVVHMKLFGSDGTAILTDTTEIAPNDAETMSIVEFEFTEAGTYYIGADGSGFYLYEMSYTYEVEEKETKETKTLLASDATGSTVARGTEYLEGLFTIYGKVDGSAVSVSSCTTTDGITDYTKLMKISGGKAVASSDVASVANCVKVVLDKAGIIRMVVSQKNATASSGVVHMKLFGSDGTAILTDTTEIAPNDAETMSIVEFEFTEAGTYYIGADGSGFYLYEISYTYVK